MRLCVCDCRRILCVCGRRRRYGHTDCRKHLAWTESTRFNQPFWVPTSSGTSNLSLACTVHRPVQYAVCFCMRTQKNYSYGLLWITSQCVCGFYTSEDKTKWTVKIKAGGRMYWQSEKLMSGLSRTGRCGKTITRRPSSGLSIRISVEACKCIRVFPPLVFTYVCIKQTPGNSGSLKKGFNITKLLR